MTRQQILTGSVRPRQHVSGDFSQHFQKKIRIHPQRIRIVFARPYENAKQWKYDSIPCRACVMLAVNDALHHGIRKPPFSSVHT